MGRNVRPAGYVASRSDATCGCPRDCAGGHPFAEGPPDGCGLEAVLPRSKPRESQTSTGFPSLSRTGGTGWPLLACGDGGVKSAPRLSGCPHTASVGAARSTVDHRASDASARPCAFPLWITSNRVVPTSFPVLKWRWPFTNRSFRSTETVLTRIGSSLCFVMILRTASAIGCARPRMPSVGP